MTQVLKHLILFLALTAITNHTGLQAQTVYITETGEKYHETGCRYLKKSKFDISLSEAKQQGYTACKVCKPGGTSYQVKPTTTKKPNPT